MDHLNSKNNLKIDFNIYNLSVWSILNMGSNSVHWFEGILKICFYGNQIRKTNLNMVVIGLRQVADKPHSAFLFHLSMAFLSALFFGSPKITHKAITQTFLHIHECLIHIILSVIHPHEICPITDLFSSCYNFTLEEALGEKYLCMQCAKGISQLHIYFKLLKITA